MLVLVVGPSGAGKDTVMGVVREMLASTPNIRFVRRTITRPAEAGGEDHEPLSEAEFLTRRFALQWQAHGLHYGIPADITDDLDRGLTVIANVSRTIIPAAARRFPVKVIEITAPPDILSQRLATRGRETRNDIATRLSRSVPLPPAIPVHTIVNTTTPAEAAARFVALLGEGVV